MKRFHVVLGLMFAAIALRAEPVKPFLHPLFTDDMILQRDVPCPIWGWTSPGAEIAVALDGQTVKTVAAEDGRWQVKIGPCPAGGPHAVVVSGPRRAALKNVLFGDVWLCSGQSNMEMGIDGVNQWWNELPGAPMDGIRLYWVKPTSCFEPAATVEGSWSVASSDGLLHKKRPFTTVGFSAIAWMFGRQVHKRTGVPVGVIDCSQGNTSIQSWSALESLRRDPDYGEALNPLAYYGSKVAEWAKASDPADAENEAWRLPTFDDRDWTKIDLPQDWSKGALPGFNGLVWFRRTVPLPPDWKGCDLRIDLGPIETQSAIWVNGTFVGGEDGYQRPHRCRIPAELLKSGDIAIVVRVLGGRGFVGKEGDMRLDRMDGAGVSVSLAGSWRFREGTPSGQMLGKRRRQYDRIWVPGGLYNGMVAPLAPFAIKGMLWYQGEGNAGQPAYERQLTEMIRDWRAAFGQGDLPFYIVQLSGFGPLPVVPGKSSWALTREIQARVARTVPNCGVAVSIDRGEVYDIHPPNKRDVAERLAAVALANAYRMHVPCQGPTYRGMQVEGNAVRVSFDHADGLKSLGSGPTGFAVAGADRRFVWAQARLDNGSVVVSAPDVKEPVAVRYGWADNALCNLYNQADLPAVPFRTDAW